MITQEKSYKIYSEIVEAVGSDYPRPKFLGNNREFHIVWKSDGGWRGYYTVQIVKARNIGWEAGASDWITGDWSDAGDAASSKVEARLDRMAAHARAIGREMVVIFLPTSNVFATNWEVFTRKIGE